MIAVASSRLPPAVSGCTPMLGTVKKVAIVASARRWGSLRLAALVTDWRGVPGMA